MAYWLKVDLEKNLQFHSCNNFSNAVNANNSYWKTENLNVKQFRITLAYLKAVMSFNFLYFPHFSIAIAAPQSIVHLLTRKTD